MEGVAVGEWGVAALMSEIYLLALLTGGQLAIFPAVRCQHRNCQITHLALSHKLQKKYFKDPQDFRRQNKKS